MNFIKATLLLTLVGSSHSFAPTFTTSRSSPASSSDTALFITLYGSQGSRSPLCNWGANELGLDLEMGDLSKNPHPFGQIPCLTDDNDVTIFESGAILLYLNSKATGNGLTESQQASVLAWVSWANASLDPICFLETPEGKVYDTGLKNPNKRIDVLDAILASQDFLVKGDIFTVADVAVASYLLYVLQFFPGIDISRWPNIVSYLQKCVARPAYASAFGEGVQAALTAALNEMGEPKKLFGMF